MTPASIKRLVFTDLDGSLLDHHTYSAEPAAAQLQRLADIGVPVIPVSSKTRAEIEVLREALQLSGPFIVENGAAVCIPENDFDTQPQGTLAREGYWIKTWSQPRAHWLAVLDEAAAEFAGEFESFAKMGAAGIAAATGLAPAEAALANTREYSEPLRWLGSPQRLAECINCLERAGAGVLQGGRFFSVSGHCDKGVALTWLRDVYRAQQPGMTIADVALGDGNNDVAMLDAAQTAVLVRSPVHPYPGVGRTQGIIRTQGYGPAGWAQGIDEWLGQPTK